MLSGSSEHRRRHGPTSAGSGGGSGPSSVGQDPSGNEAGRRDVRGVVRPEGHPTTLLALQVRTGSERERERESEEEKRRAGEERPDGNAKVRSRENGGVNFFTSTIYE